MSLTGSVVNLGQHFRIYSERRKYHKFTTAATAVTTVHVCGCTGTTVYIGNLLHLRLLLAGNDTVLV